MTLETTLTKQSLDYSVAFNHSTMGNNIRMIINFRAYLVYVMFSFFQTLAGLFVFLNGHYRVLNHETNISTVLGMHIVWKDFSTSSHTTLPQA